MKTVTDVNTVNQLLTYSKQAEAGIHQKAIQMLLGAGNNKKQDSLSISDAARGFSKQSIAGFYTTTSAPDSSSRKSTAIRKICRSTIL